MKIRVLPRIFFEKIKGTAEEDRLLESYRIISINSSREMIHSRRFPNGIGIIGTCCV